MEELSLEERLDQLRIKLRLGNTYRVVETPEDVATKIVNRVRELDGRKHGPRPVEIKDLDFNTNKTFDGYPLRRLMVPYIQGGLTYQSADALFAVWATGTKKEVDSLAKSLGIEIPRNMRTYLGAFKTQGESLVRLVWTLFQNILDDSGCELGERTILITDEDRHFGVKDGVVVTRFGTYDFQLNVKEILDKPPVTFLRDSLLVGWYKQAVAAGEQSLADAIACYGMAKHDVNWEVRLTQGKYKTLTIDRGIRAIKHEVNPHIGLCRVLVPNYISLEEFTKYFGNPKSSGRGAVDQKIVRRRLLERLVDLYEEKPCLLNIPY